MLLAALSGCRDRPAPTSYEYSLSLPSDSDFPLDDGGSPLFMNGKEIGQITSHDRSVDLVLSKEQWLHDAGTRLAVRITTSCGPVDVPFTMTGDLDTEGRWRKTSLTSKLFETMKPEMKPTMATIYVDNVDGKKEAVVAIGKIERKEAAGAKSTVLVPLGDCEGAREVHIGGEKVGEIPSLRDRYAALIDVVGGHCYAMVTARYDRPEVAGLVAHEPDKPERFSGKRILEVPQVSYLLEHAPDKVSSTDGKAAFSQLLHSKACR